MENQSIDLHQLEFCIYECATVDLINKFVLFNKDKLMLQGYEPIENIKHRIKSAPSILKKLKKKNLEISYDSIVNNIRDVAGIRLTCPFIDDVYSIFEYLKNQNNIEIIEVKDYIKAPKKNGYRAMHVILKTLAGFHKHKEEVCIEIQIRTVAMDFWATLEHKLIYKSTFLKDSKHINSELNDYANKINELDVRMTLLKNNAMNGDE